MAMCVWVCATKDYKLCLKLFICFSTEKKLQQRIRMILFDAFFFFLSFFVVDCQVWWCLVCVSSPNNDPVTHKTMVICLFILCMSFVCALCCAFVRYVSIYGIERRAIPAAHCATYVQCSRLYLSLFLTLAFTACHCMAFGCGRINCYLVNWLVLTLQ